MTSNSPQTITPTLTAVTPGGDFVGMQITVGPQNLLVPALGRWVLSGNRSETGSAVPTTEFDKMGKA